MQILMRLLREPLLHFLAIGGLIFLAYSAISGPDRQPADTIIVDAERIEQLAAGFQATWRRPPSDDELRRIVDDFVREEIYYREALALGLDRNDTMVRRRLRQKMEFLTDVGADVLNPAAGELEAHLAANEKVFQIGARLALEQVFLGEAPGPERVEQALQQLRSESGTDIATLGENTLLPARLRLSPPTAIDGVFGKGFFTRIENFPPGKWAGPVSSSYGVHLVRIDEYLPARMPSLDEARDDVLRDWKAVKAREIRELHFERLRQRYTVEIQQAGKQAAEKP